MYGSTSLVAHLDKGSCEQGANGWTSPDVRMRRCTGIITLTILEYLMG